MCCEKCALYLDRYFDVASSSNVLDHITEPRKTVGEIPRVSKPGGYFILTVEIFEEKEILHILIVLRRGNLLIVRSTSGFRRIFERESP